MPDHELMYVQKRHQHYAKTNTGGTSGPWQQQADPAGNFRDTGKTDPGIRIRVVVGHDVAVKTWMPEVVDPGRDIEHRLDNVARRGARLAGILDLSLQALRARRNNLADLQSF